jgi:hypothetical protein
MKEKIIGIVVCMLMIATAIPAVSSLNDSGITSMESSRSIQSCLSENWTEQAKLLASDGAAYDVFGGTGLLDGDTAIIGAPLDDDNGVDSGSVYIFIRTGTTWTQEAKLLPSDGAAYDYFGYTAAIDGDTALVGAINDDDNGADSGSAYIFIRTGTTWTQQAKLLASDGEAGDQFSSYGISISGDTALIGACGDDEYRGSTYVFTRNGTNWNQQQKLVAPDGKAEDYFGWWVGIDGDTALIGAGGCNQYQGAAYVFTRTDITWTQQAKLEASDGATNDQFGYCVYLSGDTALISANFDNDSGHHSGSAYVFTRTGAIWNQEAKLLPSDGDAYDEFGHSLSLDGDTALIASPFDDDKGADSGSAYIFTRTGTTWTQQAKLLPADGDANDVFGLWTVSIDGNTSLIASLRDDDNGDNSGSAYVFIKGDAPVADFSWAPQTPIQNQPIIFNASTSHDPDGFITLYEWDWNNDGIYEESNSTPTATHTWVNPGGYQVRLRVIDDQGLAGTIIKTINVSKAVDFSIDIKGGFGITADITNTGAIPATMIQWNFTLTGGLILLGKTKSDTITSLAPGASATAKDTLIFGFGKTNIQVEVTCAEGISATRTASGFVLLFFALGVQGG